MVPGVFFFLVKYLLHIAPECFTRTAATATIKRDPIIVEYNLNTESVCHIRIVLNSDPDPVTNSHRK